GAAEELIAEVTLPCSLARVAVLPPTAPPRADVHTRSLHDALPIFWATSSSAVSCSIAAQDTRGRARREARGPTPCILRGNAATQDRKSTRLNSSHVSISYAVFCLKKKSLTSAARLPSVAIHNAQKD